MQELVPYSWHYFSRINGLYVEHSVSGVLEQSSTFFKIRKQSGWCIGLRIWCQNAPGSFIGVFDWWMGWMHGWIERSECLRLVLTFDQLLVLCVHNEEHHHGHLSRRVYRRFSYGDQWRGWSPRYPWDGLRSMEPRVWSGVWTVCQVQKALTVCWRCSLCERQISYV